MFQINYKECKYHMTKKAYYYCLRFRLTIRNVNSTSKLKGILNLSCFRLTIRNVNMNVEAPTVDTSKFQINYKECK